MKHMGSIDRAEGVRQLCQDGQRPGEASGRRSGTTPDDDFVSPPKTTELSATVLVRIVGAFGIRVGGITLRPTEVGSHKARMLLGLLALRPDRYVPVDEIVTVLWEGHPPRTAVATVSALVSRLRSRLGPGVIGGGRGSYRLGSAVQVDLHRAAEAVARAESLLNIGHARQAWVTVMKALEVLGEQELYPECPDVERAESARQLLPQLTRRARLVAARAGLRSGEVTAAVEEARRAVAADPLDELACQVLMQAHAEAGEPARAVTAYARLRAVLADELGIDPSSMTSDLHLTILRGTVPSPKPQAAGSRQALIPRQVIRNVTPGPLPVRPCPFCGRADPSGSRITATPET